MRTLRNLLAIAGLLSFVFGGCTGKPASPKPVSPDAPVLKIAVFADGRLTVDDTVSTVPGLRESLQRLSEKHGVVGCYREAGQQEPPPIAMEVMRAVVDSGLPIRLSSRADYSDSIGSDGKPITK